MIFPEKQADSVEVVITAELQTEAGSDAAAPEQNVGRTIHKEWNKIEMLFSCGWWGLLNFDLILI